jgi:hypothetical protein
MEWLDFVSIRCVCGRTSLIIRNNETNDNRLKINDNGNSIKMIYEHPFANKINFSFFFDTFTRPIFSFGIILKNDRYTVNNWLRQKKKNFDIN